MSRLFPLSCTISADTTGFPRVPAPAASPAQKPLSGVSDIVAGNRKGAKDQLG
ncbi:MAG: hypothetical protein H7Z40_20945 [Phycisphaerae bacterium]|nr:hypothetical protein [Gemmatimonadaceae bacterium]